MAVGCQCAVSLRWIDRQNPWMSVAAWAAMAAHEDWQVREAAAERAHPDLFEFHPEESGIRRATLPMLHALAADRHQHVRAAAEWALGGEHIAWHSRRGHEPHWGARGPHDPGLHADAAAGRASSLPLPEREWLAEACAGSVPPELLADPICTVRLWAVFHADQDALTDPTVGVLCADPCRFVRSAVLQRVGPPAGFDLARLDEDGIYMTAEATRHPDLLAQLAGHPSGYVRRLVAENMACPTGILIDLGDDPDLLVRAAAYAHHGWPADRPVRASADPDELPSDPGRLAAAVLGTRTALRCMAGRAALAIPSGYLYPPDDAPWLCGRDAVSLHSWGAFCREHQLEVDGARKHSGADGYLGQRLANGVWAPLGQGGPLARKRDLWEGNSSPLSQ
jgi:hypothetical protein